MSRLSFIFWLIIFSEALFSQAVNPYRDHNFSGTMALTAEAGVTMGLNDYGKLKPDYAGGGSLEYYFRARGSSIFGLKAFGGVGYLAGKENKAAQTPNEFRTDLVYGGAGIVYLLSIKDRVFPYFSAGAAYLNFNPKGERDEKLANNMMNVYKKNIIAGWTELGLRFAVNRNMSFNLGGAVFAGNSDYLDDLSYGPDKDLLFTAMAGLSFSFFGENDSDKDGLYDGIDQCEYRTEDYDGFEDEDGCPDLDNDKDNIPDVFDKCPYLAEDYDGFQDEDGCPDLDNDQDGIKDSADQCPNQTEDFDGYQDKDGCPEPDNDADGILDINDRCLNQPETYNGYQDEDGCPDEKPAAQMPAQSQSIPEKFVINANANFTSGKAILLPNAYRELDKIIDLIKTNMDLKWRIEGHTDNQGKDQLNKKLSLERARAVMDYFISQGLDPSNFTAVGLGKDFPVADNKTEAGRIKNRRIVIISVK